MATNNSHGASDQMLGMTKEIKMLLDMFGIELDYGVVYVVLDADIANKTPEIRQLAYAPDTFGALRACVLPFKQRGFFAAAMLVARRINMVNLVDEQNKRAHPMLQCLVSDINDLQAAINAFNNHIIDIEEPTPGSTVIKGFDNYDKRNPQYGANDKPRVALTEDQQLDELERQRSKDFHEIGQKVVEFISNYHTDPTDVIVNMVDKKYAIGTHQTSRLVINKNLDITLPDFGFTIELHALTKAMYILFLNHPEGVELKQIDKWKQEFIWIYDIVKPQGGNGKAIERVNSLFYPGSTLLNQHISRIKRAFKLRILDDKIAERYYIKGVKGGEYSIGLDRSLVKMPRAFDFSSHAIGTTK